MGRQITIDLAESLISLGFAKTTQHMNVTSTDVQLKSYLKKLQAAQSRASKHNLPWPISVLIATISQFIYKKLLPSKYRLPELVR